MKSPFVPDYGAIKKRIRDDMGKGKTRFWVDLGVHPLDDGLRLSLEKYKAKRQIESLIVLADDGHTMTVI